MPHGDLQVYVEGALNIKNTAIMGKSSPYCILTVGTQSYKSNVATERGTKPYWNQTFQYKIDRSTNDLKILIKAKNSLRDDDFLGETNLAFVEVFREKHDIPVASYQVIRFGKHQGEIRLGFNFYAKKAITSRFITWTFITTSATFLKPRSECGPGLFFNGTEDESSNDGSSRRVRFKDQPDDYYVNAQSPQPSHDSDPGRGESLPPDFHPPPPHQFQHARWTAAPAHVQQQHRLPSLPPFYEEQRRMVAEEDDVPVWPPRRPERADPRGFLAGPPSHDSSGFDGRYLQNPAHGDPQNKYRGHPGYPARQPAYNVGSPPLDENEIPVADTHLKTPFRVGTIDPSRLPSIDYPFADVPSPATMSCLPQIPIAPEIPKAEVHAASKFTPGQQVQDSYTELVAPVIAVSRGMPTERSDAANVGPLLSEDDKPLYVSRRHLFARSGSENIVPPYKSGRVERDSDAESDGSRHSRRSNLSQEHYMSRLSRPLQQRY